MPTKALQSCSTPGCSALVESGYCLAHRRNTALGWREDPDRIRGRPLQRLRMALYKAEHHCRSCGVGLSMHPQAGNRMIRDHIVPLFEGGTEDPANIQPLCLRCSDIKSQAEAQRAKR